MMLMQSVSRLCSAVAGATIPPVGLTTRQSWRINHPQADDGIGKVTPYFNQTALIRLVLPVLGAWVGSQRKRPHCAFLCQRWFAATRSALSLSDIGKTPMIYTFLIAPKGLKLSALKRARRVSCYASNLTQARAVFAGLSLALVRRTPAQGGPRHA